MTTKKREDLINRINEIKSSADAKTASLFNEIIAELSNEKKYGLVWDRENTIEDVVKECINNIPVLEVDETKTIQNGGQNNVLIEGDNFHSLLALNMIARESVDLIYIDPPYNTKNKDFIYNDTFVDEDDSFRHSKWLSFMESRLKLAKDLMNETGLIFISIDDNEQPHLSILCDEIFGSHNHVATFIIDKTAQGANQSSTFKTQHEYCVLYKKSSSVCIDYETVDNEMPSKYKYKDDKGYFALTNSFDSINSPLTSNKKRGYTVYYNNKINEVEIRDEYNKEKNIFEDYDKSLMKKGYIPIRPGIRNKIQYPWNWEINRFLSEWKDELVIKENKKGNYEIYHKNRYKGKTKDTTIKKYDTRHTGNNVLIDVLGNKAFDYPKSIEMMKWVISKHNNKNSTILDFFAGSGTTGQAVLELNKEDGGNRRFILCTNNENNICEDITYQRLKTVITGKRKDKSKYSDGLNGSLYYLKTAFAKNHDNSDQAKYNLSDKLDALICIKENIFEKTKKNKYYSHYLNDKKHLFIFNDYYNEDKFNEFINEIKNANGHKIVYLFSVDNSLDDSLFDGLDDIEIKTMPSKSYGIYKEIIEEIKNKNNL